MVMRRDFCKICNRLVDVNEDLLCDECLEEKYFMLCWEEMFANPAFDCGGF